MVFVLLYIFYRPDQLLTVAGYARLDRSILTKEQNQQFYIFYSREFFDEAVRLPFPVSCFQSFTDWSFEPDQLKPIESLFNVSIPRFPVIGLRRILIVIFFTFLQSFLKLSRLANLNCYYLSRSRQSRFWLHRHRYTSHQEKILNELAYSFSLSHYSDFKKAQAESAEI